MKKTKAFSKILIILFAITALVAGIVFSNQLNATDISNDNTQSSETTMVEEEGISDEGAVAPEDVEPSEVLSPEDSYMENKIDNVILSELENFEPEALMSRAVGKENILGGSTVSINTVKAYLKSIIGAANYTSYHDQVIQAYYDIAPLYGIRPEVLISQSMLETNYFRYTGIVKRDQYNFAGIYATGTAITATQAGNVSYINGANPNKVKLVAGEHGARFSSIANGVEGHIQHLYAYATKNAIPGGRDLIDPRYRLVTTTPNFGKYTYIEDLVGWATDPEYGSKISKVLKSISATETNPAGLTPVTNIANGYYKINSVANGFAIEPTGDGYENTQVIKQNTTSNKSSQTMYFEKQTDGSYVITFYHSKKSLDLNGSNIVTQWTTHKKDNQRWLLYTNGQNIFLKNKSNNSFIEIQNNNANETLKTNATVTATDLKKQFKINPVAILPTTPYITEVPNGLYKIQSVLSGKYLEIYGGTHNNGAFLSQWINNNYDNQVFEIQNTIEGSYIIGTGSKKFLDSDGYVAGTQIIQRDKSGSASQQFKLVKSPNGGGKQTIISIGGTAFNVQDQFNGAQIVLSNTSGTAYQDFIFVATSAAPAYPQKTETIQPVTDLANGYYSINSRVNGLALETVNSGYDDYQLVKQNTASNKSSQTMYFEKQSDGSYVITFYHSKKSLDINGSNMLSQWTTHKKDNQRWMLYKDSQGNYLIKSKTTNGYVEIIDSTLNGDLKTNTVLASGSNDEKKFDIKPVNILPTMPYVAEVDSGLYKIQSELSGRNLEIYGGTHDTGGMLSQWSANNYDNQVFEVQNTTEGSYIIPSGSKKPLDTDGYANGTKIIQREKSNSPSQKFKLVKSSNGDGKISIISAGGTAFDVQDSANGTPTVLRNTNKTAYQDFKFISSGAAPEYPRKETIEPMTDLADGYYTINSLANGLALEPINDGYEDYQLVKQNTASNKSSQTMYFEKQSDGSYVITFYHSKKSLDINGSNMLSQWTTHKKDNQRWMLYKDSQGNYLIKSKSTNGYVEVINSVLNSDLKTNTTLTASNPNKKFTLKPVTTLPTTPYVAEFDGGLYKIQSILSGRNLEIYGGSLIDGGELSQWSNNGYNNQVFEVQNTRDGSYIISAESGKALDPVVYADGTKITQKTKSASPSQKFKIIKSPNAGNGYSIISGGGTAFDVQYSTDGTRTVLKNVSGTNYQDFKFVKTAIQPPYPANVTISDGIYEMISKSNGKALTMPGFSVKNGSGFGFANSTKGSDQKFVVEQLPNKNYKITQFNSNRILQPLNNTSNNNGAIVQWYAIDNAYQQWAPVRNADGSYSLKNVGTGKYLDVSASSTLVQTARSTSASQKFSLNRLANKPATSAKKPGISGKTIYIDPGHGTYDSYYSGYFDPGAVGNGLQECNSNMWIASELATRLRASGATVIMSRSQDYSPANAPKLSLMERARLANNTSADLFISIHGNSAVASAHGIETYYYKPSSGEDSYYTAGESKNVKSREAAKFVQEEMINFTGRYNRGVKQEDFLVLRETKTPAILLEIGFISNPTEASLLKSPTFRTTVVNGIVNGVHRYFSLYY